MRFGISGCFLPDDMDALTPEMCQRVRALGFSGIFTRFRANDPHTTPQAKAQRVRDMLAGEGVRLFQATGYWQNMVTPDEAVRGETVRTVQAALRLAGWDGRTGHRHGTWLDESRWAVVPAPRQLDRDCTPSTREDAARVCVCR